MHTCSYISPVGLRVGTTTQPGLNSPLRRHCRLSDRYSPQHQHHPTHGDNMHNHAASSRLSSTLPIARRTTTKWGRKGRGSRRLMSVGSARGTWRRHSVQYTACSNMDVFECAKAAATRERLEDSGREGERKVIPPFNQSRSTVRHVNSWWFLLMLMRASGLHNHNTIHLERGEGAQSFEKNDIAYRSLLSVSLSLSFRQHASLDPGPQQITSLLHHASPCFSQN